MNMTSTCIRNRKVTHFTQLFKVSASQAEMGDGYHFLTLLTRRTNETFLVISPLKCYIFQHLLHYMFRNDHSSFEFSKPYTTHFNSTIYTSQTAVLKVVKILTFKHIAFAILENV